MDEGSYVPPPMQPGTPERPAAANPLTSGWLRATGHAVLILVVLGLIAEIVVFLLYTAADKPGASRVVYAKAGGAMFFSFHHTGIVFDAPRVAFPRNLIPGAPVGQLPANLAIRLTAVLPLLAGTVLLLWLFQRAGRDVAGKAGAAPPWLRAIHGAKVAVPYAILCFAAAWGVRFSLPTPQGRITFHPSYVAALLWPLGLGILFGALGGLRSAPLGEWSANPWWRRARGALSGGGWMIALGLLFSFAGLLVLGAVKPSATKAYFQIFDEGVVNGIAGIAATLLIVPNMATWVLFPSMGTCLTASAHVIGPSFSFCFLSYTQFPREGGAAGGSGLIPSGALPNPPIGFYLFILAPLLAVLLGGVLAARRGGAETRQEAVGLGAAAGFLFGLAALLALVLATIRASGNFSGAAAAQNFTFEGSVIVGPDLLPGVLLSLAWGLVGGAIGGLIEGRSRPTAVSPAPDAWGTTAPAAPPLPPVPPG